MADDSPKLSYISISCYRKNTRDATKTFFAHLKSDSSFLVLIGNSLCTRPNFASHKHINSFRDLSAYSEAQTDGHIYMASSIRQAILINMCCL